MIASPDQRLDVMQFQDIRLPQVFCVFTGCENRACRSMADRPTNGPRTAGKWTGQLLRRPRSGLDDFRLSNYCNPTGPVKAPSVVLLLTLLLRYESSEAPFTANRPTPLAVTLELRTRMAALPPATRP